MSVGSLRGLSLIVEKDGFARQISERAEAAESAEGWVMPAVERFRRQPLGPAKELSLVFQRRLSLTDCGIEKNLRYDVILKPETVLGCYKSLQGIRALVKQMVEGDTGLQVRSAGAVDSVAAPLDAAVVL